MISSLAEVFNAALHGRQRAELRFAKAADVPSNCRKQFDSVYSFHVVVGDGSTASSGVLHLSWNDEFLQQSRESVGWNYGLNEWGQVLNRCEIHARQPTY